jgi:hypothetical protein
MDTVGDFAVVNGSVDAFDLEGRQAPKGQAGAMNSFADGILDGRPSGREIDRLFNRHPSTPCAMRANRRLDYLGRPARGEMNVGVR